MEENRIRISNKWLQQLSNGVGSPVDVLTSQSLKVVQAQKGLIRCRFIVSDRLSDGDGNWHVGAMTTLIDNIAGATVQSFSSQIRPTLNFSMSYYSTAKIQEEVEIEAKVVAEKGKLTSVVIKIKNENGQLIALAKQWTASNNNAGRGSELWTALNTTTTNNNTTTPKSVSKSQILPNEGKSTEKFSPNSTGAGQYFKLSPSNGHQISTTYSEKRMAHLLQIELQRKTDKKQQ